MSFYIDLDERIPVMYYRAKGSSYRLPRSIKGMDRVESIPCSAVQLTERNLLAELYGMVDRSTEGIA